MLSDDERRLNRQLKDIERITDKLNNVSELNSRLERVSMTLEKARIGDIIENYNNPRRILFLNFIVGLARGLGLTVGTAIILTLFGFILKEFISIPFIGKYISEIIDYVKLDQYYGG